MRKELFELLDIISGRTERFDEMGFPDEKGEYNIDGFPLPITD